VRVCARRAKRAQSRGRSTAVACGPNSRTLTTSKEENLNTKVVDPFELYNLESEFVLFGLRMRKLWSNTKDYRIRKV